MKYVISAKDPFQFNLGPVVYSFDTEEPTALSDEHYKTIVERIGSIHLTEVEAPEVKTEELKEEEIKEDAE